MVSISVSLTIALVWMFPTIIIRQKDQILQIPIPNSSGFSSSLMNAGSVNNHGFEISLSGRPVETKDFSWDLGFTLSRNYSKVKKLHDGLKSIQMYFVEAMSVRPLKASLTV